MAIDPKGDAVKQWGMVPALTFLLLALWCLTHRYQGLGGDAGLYAVQALARAHPNLLHDLFLHDTSQDSYTFFSPFYACCIGLFGLRHAALILAIAFKVWFFAAAWALARELSTRDTAWLSVALLIIIVGAYGAYGVFHYAEDWLTARSLAEALVATAVALYFRGLRTSAFLIVCGAMLVHPLMALPGLLVLICLGFPFRQSSVGAAAAVIVSLGTAIAARWSPNTQVLMLMDAHWLEVVRERSQFLFLQLWRASDWQQTARVFLSLTLSAIAIEDSRVRKLCTSAMLVGATGLAVALVASTTGPLAILLQGQAWRWVWVGCFASVLLVAPTVRMIRRDPKCGLLCSIVIISGWTIPPLDGAACLGTALTLWLLRHRISTRAAVWVRWVSVAAAAAIIIWVVHGIWSLAWSWPSAAGRDPSPLGFVRDLFAIQILAIGVFGALAYGLRTSHSPHGYWITCAATLASLVFLLPDALRDHGTDGTSAEIEKFLDWRSAIPPDSNVFVLPAHNSAAFAWFTLERPSYLTVDQSSGVVFSRSTALEVRRRSEVLLPLQDPDWRLLSNMHKPHSDGASSGSSSPLTRDRLISLCSDPQLNFVVAREDVGFEPIRHTRSGNWKDWNLYDCRRVHAVNPSA